MIVDTVENNIVINGTYNDCLMMVSYWNERDNCFDYIPVCAPNIFYENCDVEIIIRKKRINNERA